jgi:MFS family permease
MIVISIFWAGITTLLTGLIGGLVAFITLRVLTGLGEGLLYSNDRSLVTLVTPPEKLGFGLGVVMGGLTVGLAAALVGTVPLIQLASAWGENAWKSPFLILGGVTIIVAYAIYLFMKPDDGQQAKKEPYGSALANLLKYTVVFLVVIMAVYFITSAIGLSDVAIAVILTLLAFLLIAYIFMNKGMEVRPVLRDRSLILMNISWIAILWHLWFYSYWGGAIVKDFGGGALTTAFLVISFNAIAGVVGFPLGGKISDWVAHKKNGRRNVLMTLEGVLAVLIFVFTAYVMSGKKDMITESVILFISGLIFFGLQAVGHAIVGEIAPDEHRGAAFGMFNLVSEIGAVLCPVVSGALRDSTGGWGVPLIVDGVMMAIACLLMLGVTSPVRVGVNKN